MWRFQKDRVLFKFLEADKRLVVLGSHAEKIFWPKDGLDVLRNRFAILNAESLAFPLDNVTPGLFSSSYMTRYASMFMTFKVFA